MNKLKPIEDLPAAQQKALFIILCYKRPGFRTSEIRDKMGKTSGGRSAGAVLGALSRNGYLKKVSGGRDKTWALATEVRDNEKELKDSLREIKVYWS